MTKNSKKHPISVVIVAKNEADNLKRCLGSVCEWVEEIIVVINDCTDDTESVAKSFGARVYEHPWRGFRDQKNLALTYATQEWILSIDADEAVSQELRCSIEEFLDRASDSYSGAYFPRKVWFLGRWITHGEWYPDLSLRLFKNGEAIWGGGDVHEKLVLEGFAKRLNGDLYHYSYPSLKAQLNKISTFADLDLQEQLKRGKKWSAGGAIFRSFWRFMKGYVIKRGFLDGFPGFYAACFMAFAVFFRYTRLYEHIIEQKTLQGYDHE